MAKFCLANTFILSWYYKKNPTIVRLVAHNWPQMRASKDEGKGHSLLGAGSVRVCVAPAIMREIVHMQAGQCGNQIGAKVNERFQKKKDLMNLMLYLKNHLL